MNNGKYFSLQDLARVDLMIRSDAAKKIDQQGWYPVVTAETLEFKKSLKLFDRFEIATRILGWDEKSFYLEHQFVRGEQIMAKGFIRARFLKKSGGSVSTTDLVRVAEFEGEKPELSPSVKKWVDSLS